MPELYFDLHAISGQSYATPDHEPPQRDGTDFTKIQNGFLFRSMILKFRCGDCFCRDKTGWGSAPLFWPGLSLALSRGPGSHVARTQHAGNFVSSWAPQKRTYTLPHGLRFATSADLPRSGQALHIIPRYTSTGRINLPIFAFCSSGSRCLREQPSTSTHLHCRFLVYHRSVLNPIFGKEVKARF